MSESNAELKTNSTVNQDYNSREEKVVEEKKGLNALQIIAIVLLCLLIAVLLAMLLYNLLYDKNQQQQQQKGVVVEDKKNSDSGIDVKATGPVNDANGEEINVGSKIVNETDINMSSDAELAVMLETNGTSNVPVTINGERVYGRVMVDDGIVSWYDAQNNYHSMPKDNVTITYGGAPVSTNVVDLMDSITYDSSGTMIFKDCKTIVSYDDNHNATISYQNNNGNSYGSTSFENVTKDSNGVYYSNGEKLDQQYQDMFSKYDNLMNNSLHNNSVPKTNLTDTAPQKQLG